VGHGLGQDDFKIIFNSKQLRASLEIPVEFLNSEKACPDAFWPKVIQKFEGIRKSGGLVDFVLYRRQFELSFNRIKKVRTGSSHSEKTVRIPIAQAWRKFYHDIRVQLSNDQRVVCTLKAEMSVADRQELSETAVRAYVEETLQSRGVTQKINQAQLQAFTYLLRRVGYIENYELCVSDIPKSRKGFQLIANDHRGEIVAIIRDPALLKKDRQANLSETIIDTLERINQSEGNRFHFLKDRFIEDLDELALSVRPLGVGLPVIALVAFNETQIASLEKVASLSSVVAHDQRISQVESQKAQKQFAVDRPANKAVLVRPSNALIAIDISPDRMEAKIGEWDPELYDHPRFEADRDWLEKQIDLYGITKGFDSFVKDLVERMKNSEDLSNSVIARGQEGNPPSDPFLYPVYKEVSSLADDESISFLNRRAIGVVSTGDPIAEIRFRDVGKSGHDVVGGEVDAIAPTDFTFNIGEGVRRDGMRFIATSDGCPDVSDTGIAVSDTFIVNGDVSLKTGSIYFQGHVEIKGAIDNGVEVEVGGNLTVHGTVRGAYVIVGGRLTAHQGIVTGGQGFIRVKNDIQAEFIENSAVLCIGNVLVKRAIINSKVTSGGKIKVNTQTGVISGGVVSANEEIQTARLGLQRGMITAASVGSDWKIEYAITNRRSRLETLTAKLDSVRLELRETTRKKKMTNNPKLEIQISMLTQYIKKGRPIAAKLEAKIEEYVGQQKYNKEAKIVVHEVLTTATRLVCGGETVPVPTEVAGVVVTGEKRGGTYIQALDPNAAEEPEAEQGQAEQGKAE
jgi:uncharacterized protein